MTRSLPALLLTACLFAAGSAAADPYRSVPVGISGARETLAAAINVGGTVVGQYVDATGTHGFSAIHGTYRRIDAPGATGYTTASGINASGTIVGSFSTGTVGHGFILKNGAFRQIDYPGAKVTIVNAVNSHDDVVGAYQDERRTVHGFIYASGAFHPLDEPDARPGRQGLMTMANGINDKGVVVGTYSGPKRIHGFTYEKGRFATLDAPGSVFATRLGGITNDGTIAGTGYGPDGEAGFVLFKGLYLRRMGASDPGTDIQNINDRGVLTARVDGDTRSSVLMIPTGPGPRPILWLSVMAGTLLTATLGFFVLAWQYARRRSPAIGDPATGG